MAKVAPVSVLGLAFFVTLSSFVFLSLGQEKLGRHCSENPPTLNPNYGFGFVKDIGGLKAYVSGHSKRGILLVSDIFGYEAPHLRDIADRVALAGFYAVVPDFFYGDPYVQNSSRTIEEWSKNHGTDKGFKDAKKVTAALRKEGIHAVGAAGFCWGGKVVAQLASTNFTKATVLLHPSRVTLDDIKAVKVPISILAAELDNGTPPELLKQFEEALTENKIENRIKIFPKVQHGWTVRYNDSDSTAVKAAIEAHIDMFIWLSKYLRWHF
ncbi:endo-1,3;1,4-beta-D-glucanase-like [Quercus robur]|uniref:endo-1,3;1,4-beta-D-glucanase-like n=1 Tax=Quercus robur TaxID=38942 RepID=UPI002161F764|nr:endo-1,3;1,4-beta-D-glucanase-like [Quercus robur]